MNDGSAPTVLGLDADPYEAIRHRLLTTYRLNGGPAMLGFLTGFSGLTTDYRLHARMQAPSGAGKTSLVSAVLEMLPADAAVRVSRLTTAGLLGAGRIPLLVADELTADEGLRRLLRQLISTGGMDQLVGTPCSESKRVRVEGGALLDVALPDAPVDSQDASRLLVAQLDDSPEQVRHTAGLVARRFTGAGRADSESWQAFASSVRDFVGSIRADLRVDIDRPERLIPSRCCSPIQLPRRLEQVLTLTAVITLLRQHGRRIDGSVVSAEDADLDAAATLLRDARVLDEWEAVGSVEERFFHTLTTLPLPQAGFTYEHVQDALRVAAAADGGSFSNPGGSLFEYHTIRRRLLALENRGLVRRKSGARPVLWTVPEHFRLWGPQSLFAQMRTVAATTEDPPSDVHLQLSLSTSSPRETRRYSGPVC